MGVRRGRHGNPQFLSRQKRRTRWRTVGAERELGTGRLTRQKQHATRRGSTVERRPATTRRRLLVLLPHPAAPRELH